MSGIDNIISTDYEAEIKSVFLDLIFKSDNKAFSEDEMKEIIDGVNNDVIHFISKTQIEDARSAFKNLDLDYFSSLLGRVFDEREYLNGCIEGAKIYAKEWSEIISTLQDEYVDLQNNHREKCQDYENLEKNFGNLEDENDELKQRIEELEKYESEVDVLKEQIKELEEEIDSTMQENSYLVDEVNTLNADISYYRNALYKESQT